MKKFLVLLAAANVMLLAVAGAAVSLLMAKPATAATPRLQVTTGTIEYLASGYSCGTTGTSSFTNLDVVTGLSSFGSSDKVVTGLTYGSDVVSNVSVSYGGSLSVSRSGLNTRTLAKQSLRVCRATVVTGVTMR